MLRARTWKPDCWVKIRVKITYPPLAGDLGQFIYLNVMILKIGVIIISHQVVSRLNGMVNVNVIINSRCIRIILGT